MRAELARTWGLGRSLLVYYGQPWKRRRRAAFYAQFIGPGDLCFDVGAHVGNRVGCWLGLGARVVAVEPQPDLVRVLRRLYGRHERVHILPVGLAEAAGVGHLRVSTATPTVSSFSPTWIEQTRRDPSFAGVRWDAEVTVPVRTLDGLIAEHGVPAFCKLDVEGLEAQVLAGLSEPVRAVSFEYLPVAFDRAVACVRRLEGLGRYRYRRSAGERMQWLDPGWCDGPQMVRVLEGLDIGEGSGDVYARRMGA